MSRVFTRADLPLAPVTLPEDWPLRCDVIIGGAKCGRPADLIGQFTMPCGHPNDVAPGCRKHVAAALVVQWYNRDPERTCKICGAPGEIDASVKPRARLANEGDLP